MNVENVLKKFRISDIKELSTSQAAFVIEAKLRAVTEAPTGVAE